MNTEKKTFFYVRTEDEKQVVYVWKNVLWIWWILGIGAVLFVVAELFFYTRILLCIWGPVFLGYCIFSMATCAGATSEIKEATRKGFVKVTGSKYSSSKPLTVVIEKAERVVQRGEAVLPVPCRVAGHENTGVSDEAGEAGK